jgi:hypothetical protein
MKRKQTGSNGNGNEDDKSSINVNKKSKKTASDLYSKTTERALAIRNAGYNLIEMWECDFVN